MKTRVSPEDDKTIDWVPVDAKMLQDMYEASLKRKAKRNKPKTFMGGYGMIVTVRKK